jgi:hypothetical protein
MGLSERKTAMAAEDQGQAFEDEMWDQCIKLRERAEAAEASAILWETNADIAIQRAEAAERELERLKGERDGLILQRDNLWAERKELKARLNIAWPNTTRGRHEGL